MNKCLFALICTLFFSNASFAKPVIPKRFHGSYSGVSPLLASRGYSFEDSRQNFRVTADGVYWERRINDLPFEIFYSNSILADLKELPQFEVPFSFRSTYFAIKQSERSRLAAIILNFSKQMLGNTPMHATATLGEGMPAPLGAFVKNEGLDAATINSHVRALYNILNGGRIKSDEDSTHLNPVDMKEAVAIMASDNTDDKINLLTNAGEALWMGTDNEISMRLPLLRQGTLDPSPQVQLATLLTIQQQARVSGATSIVIDLLKSALFTSTHYGNEVLDTAIITAGILMEDLLEYQETHANVRIAFQLESLELDFSIGFDLNRIFAKTNGIIKSEHVKLLEFAAKRHTTINAWSIVDYMYLQAFLANIASNEKNIFTQYAATNAARISSMADQKMKAISSRLDSELCEDALEPAK